MAVGKPNGTNAGIWAAVAGTPLSGFGVLRSPLRSLEGSRERPTHATKRGGRRPWNGGNLLNLHGATCGLTWARFPRFTWPGTSSPVHTGWPIGPNPPNFVWRGHDLAAMAWDTHKALQKHVTIYGQRLGRDRTVWPPRTCGDTGHGHHGPGHRKSQ